MRRRVAEVSDMLGLDELLGESRRSSRAASASGWRWAGRCHASRPCSCWTSRSRTSTPQLRTELRAELKRLHAQVGTTMIFVTHDQVEAMTLGDRIAVLDRGRLQQFGSPDEVYRRPCNLFVARFVGSPSMNLLPGPVLGLGSRTCWPESGRRRCTRRPKPTAACRWR